MATGFRCKCHRRQSLLQTAVQPSYSKAEPTFHTRPDLAQLTLAIQLCCNAMPFFNEPMRPSKTASRSHAPTQVTVQTPQKMRPHFNKQNSRALECTPLITRLLLNCGRTSLAERGERLSRTNCAKAKGSSALKGCYICS